MKKPTILLCAIILVLLVLFAGYTLLNKQQTGSISTIDNRTSTNDIWSSINETSWFKANGWTGEVYVFYTDNHNVKKCIHQILGSGVVVAESNFVDIEIIDSDKIKIEGIVYKLENKSLVSDSVTLTPSFLGTSAKVLSNACGSIDIEFVKSDEFNIKNTDQGCDYKNST